MSTQASSTISGDSMPGGAQRGNGGLSTPGIALLAGLLVAQLLLALGLGWTGRNLGDTTAGTPLLPFGADQVDHIEINQPGQDPVTLERKDAGWILPGLAGFPAAGHKVDALLTKLAGIERRLPVATSDGALERFKVTDDGYERQLIARTADGAATELLFGDSPGFRRIFVRPAGETAVYEVPLAVSDIAARSDDWTDKTVLQLMPEEIRRVHLPDLELIRGDDGWQLQGLTEQESLDTEKADQLIRTLSGLSFNAVRPAAAEDTSEGAQAPESAMDLQLTLEDDKTLDYRLIKTANEEYLLTVSTQPYRFVISQYQAEQLLEQRRAGLLHTQE